VNHLARTVLAEIRRHTGRTYPGLEKHLAELPEPALSAVARDLLRIVRDVQDAENSRLQSRMQQMGLPRGVVR